MGYSHYFTPKMNKEQFDKVVEDVKEIEKAVELFDGIGDKRGVVYGNESLMFNGNEAEGEAHETLSLGVGGDWGFCKTARKPYDTAVAVTLLCMKFHSPESEVTSDGNSKDWSKANRLFKKLFPKRQKPKMKY